MLKGGAIFIRDGGTVFFRRGIRYFFQHSDMKGPPPLARQPIITGTITGMFRITLSTYLSKIVFY